MFYYKAMGKIFLILGCNLLLANKDLIFIYGFLGGLDGGGGGEDVDAELLQVLHLLLDHLLDEGVQIDRERQEDLDR